MKNLLFLPLILFVTGLHAQSAIPGLHAHNDYMHNQPLYESLKNGATSIEVDVCFWDGSLRVSHDYIFLNTKPTLQQLYLDPLRDIICKNDGWVYKEQKIPVTLMIDLKGDGELCYDVLRNILKDYLDIITWYTRDTVIQGPLKILVSGSKPYERIEAEKIRYVTIDGSFSDLDTRSKFKSIARVSDPFGKYYRLKWLKTKGSIKYNKLIEQITTAHAQNREVRFYAAPQNKTWWKLMMDLKGDWVNVDKLAAYKRFYNKIQKEKKRLSAYKVDSAI